MRRIIALTMILVLALAIANVHASGAAKKVIMIFAPNQFRDEELFETKKLLEDAGMTVKTASTKLGPAKGMLGGVAKADMLISDVKSNSFDAIVFVGGSGAEVLFDNKTAQDLAKSFYSSGKLTAAICIAPVILANAGILQGKQATVFNSEAGIIKAKGAQYTGKNVTIDGKLITANGPGAVSEFANAIIDALGK